MNIHSAITEYVKRIIAEPGMKALLLDDETTSMVGMVFSQSEIISKQVFLVERVDSPKTKEDEDKQAAMHHLKALIFVRPTLKSVKMIKARLKSPKYKEYHIFFSNIIPRDLLQSLAEADQYELVKQVQEYYADYYALNEDLFHFNLFENRSLSQSLSYGLKKEEHIYERNLQGLTALLLSLKKRPAVRYDTNSELAHKFAKDISMKMKQENSLFFFKEYPPTLLLILDRVDDPVTPLLQQWTYQAMMHELVGIKQNRVDLRNVPGIRKELREVVLSPQQDHFYKGSMYLNFGDLGTSVKDLVQNFQRKQKDTTKLETIDDMQKFVDNYPELRAMSGNVSKHVAMMSELSRIVTVRQLMDVSELEQEMVCSLDHSTSFDQVKRMLERQLRFDEKLRLVMLFAIKFENEKQSIGHLKNQLQACAMNQQEVSKVNAVDEILIYAGKKSRGGDLFQQNFFSKASKFFTGGLKGVENVYTQHKPLLASTLDDLLKSKLKTIDYPFIDSNSRVTKTDYKHIIIYMLGGTTYEEHTLIHKLSEDNVEGVRIILGGSCIHNSKTFIQDILGSSSSSYGQVSRDW